MPETLNLFHAIFSRRMRILSSFTSSVGIENLMGTHYYVRVICPLRLQKSINRTRGQKIISINERQPISFSKINAHIARVRNAGILLNHNFDTTRSLLLFCDALKFERRIPIENNTCLNPGIGEAEAL